MHLAQWHVDDVLRLHDIDEHPPIPCERRHSQRHHTTLTEDVILQGNEHAHELLKALPIRCQGRLRLTSALANRPTLTVVVCRACPACLSTIC